MPVKNLSEEDARDMWRGIEALDKGRERLENIRELLQDTGLPVAYNDVLIAEMKAAYAACARVMK